ncbi:hypothetical protein V6N11_037638 [Hibiscus sabdariffa]|uniref:Uncharacterized protein n=2 Tax=Hibiscus sabdariffa TaxID=183260 RepID=A0ABR2PBV6_9ROSI
MLSTQENLNSNVTIDLTVYENFDGRLSDHVPSVPVVPPRERSASTIQLEDHSSKKDKSICLDKKQTVVYAMGADKEELVAVGECTNIAAEKKGAGDGLSI